MCLKWSAYAPQLKLPASEKINDAKLSTINIYKIPQRQQRQGVGSLYIPPPKKPQVLHNVCRMNSNKLVLEGRRELAAARAGAGSAEVIFTFRVARRSRSASLPRPSPLLRAARSKRAAADGSAHMADCSGAHGCYLRQGRTDENVWYGGYAEPANKNKVCRYLVKHASEC